jgi:GPI ethanolamine phosphate transferase 1
LAFKPFDAQASGEIDARIRDIDQLIAQRKYTQAQQRALELIQVALRGMHFFQTYDWQMLISVVMLGFVGWIMVVIKFILQTYTTLLAQQYPLSAPTLTVCTHSDIVMWAVVD